MSRAPGSACAPARIVEWELTEVLAPIDVESRYRALRVLMRLGGAPIGWLVIERPGPRVAPEYLRALAASRVLPDLERHALRTALETPLDDALLPAISIIVCTRDRARSLARCLESLVALDYPAFEVIVVDNAPTSDETAAVAASFAGRLALRYVREDHPGLDWARNRGLVEARGEIIAYTDDDVRVDRGWLRGVALGFADPAVRLVTGLVAPAEIETDAQVVFEDWYGGMGKGFRARTRDPLAGGPSDRLGAHQLGVGANMAFRREWLERLGGFDTALDVGTPSHGAGDLDIFHRTLAAGGVARYEPRALVWHHHRRETAALRRQLTDNGRAFGVYLLTRWWRHERPRRAVIRYAIGTWLWWLLLRIPRRLLRRDRMPLALQAAELWGVAQAPWAWYATYRGDRRLRRHDDACPSRLAPAASLRFPPTSP